MKLWLVRAAVLAGLLALGALAWRLLEPIGLGWIVYLVLGLIAAVLGGELALRASRRRGERARWRRWKAALLDRGARASAIAQLTTELERARERGGRARLLQARLAIALAELLLADGRSEEATATLSRIPVASLDPGPAALVRLARAQAYLHRDDRDGARATLAALDERLDDPVLDASLVLARGALALVEDRVGEALEAAERVADLAAPGDELHAEAVVLAAAARCARGDDDARGGLDELPDEARARARALAPGRARALLEGE